MRGRTRRAIQRIAMTKLMTLFAIVALAGCPKSDKTKEAPAPVAKTTEPAPADKAALPADCNDYKAAIDKLAGCDKLPPETRDQLKKSYDTTSAAWTSLTPEAKAGLVTSCKAALDAVNAAAKTTCGW